MKNESNNTNHWKKSLPREVLVLDNQTRIYQSNRIVRGRYRGFTLIQLKVFATIIKHLQQAIIGEINDKTGQQLSLFHSLQNYLSQGNVKIPIPLHLITGNQNYRTVLTAVDEMRNLRIELPPPAGYAKTVSSVIVKYDVPQLVHGRSILNVYIPYEVAECLVHIDKDGTGNAREYHHYLYEVIMSASSKYTFRLYMLLSRWKNLGSYRTTYAELRDQLGIAPEEYVEFKNFRARVLLPAQKELKNRADCWFDCEAEGFEERTGKSVCFLNFRIILAAAGEAPSGYAERLVSWLQTQLKFTTGDIRSISFIFKDMDRQKYETLMETCSRCLEMYYQKSSTGDPVRNLSAYVIHSLKQVFPQAS